MTISQKFRNILIKNYIGDMYYKMNKETQKYLIYSACNDFNKDMITKYGSIHNYLEDMVRKRGFKNITAYQQWCVQCLGYKNLYEYQTENAKNKGFKSRWDMYFNKYYKKGEIKRPVDFINQQVRKKGFKDWHDYENSLYQKKGFKDRADYWRFKTLRKKYSKNVVPDLQLRKMQLEKEKKKNKRILR